MKWPIHLGLRTLFPATLVAGAVFVASAAAAAPTVTAIAPAAGNTAGGTPVTVTGSGFLPGAAVRIGGVNCTQVKVVTSNTIIAVSGANGAGLRRVTVLNTASDSSGVDGLYTYNSRTDLTKTTKAHFEASGSSLTNLATTGLDSTLRWTNWTPTTGGSMSNATYYYVVTTTNAAGETQRSAQSAGVTLSGGNNAVELDWTAVSGALQYKLYRTTTSGTYTSPSLIATLSATGHTDIAASAFTGAPPASSTATGDMFLASGTTPATSFSAGPATTGGVGADGFSLQRPNAKFLVVHGNNGATTSIYDPTADSFSAGPNTTANAGLGAHGLKRPNGTFLIVHGGTATSTSVYDPVANTMVAGPASTAVAGEGGHAIKRSDGKFLIVHGKASTTTSIYDPVANTMSDGPTLTAVAGGGAFAFQRPDGKFLIVLGKDTPKTSIYDGSTNTVTAGPDATTAVGDGAHGIQRHDGRVLIVAARGATATCLYDPVANSMTAGPSTTMKAAAGSHSLERADGTFLVFEGNNKANSEIYDPVANTMSAGPTISSQPGTGAHSLQRPDGQYMLMIGNGSTTTQVYDAGWYRTGTYISEKLNPGDLNWWNTFSWVRDSEDTVTVKIKTASSSAGLEAAGWRTVAKGGSVAAGAGETWMQIGADYARAIPKTSGAWEDVWGRWLAEFRTWSRPDILSFTANYTPTTLSVSPSKSTFAFGGQPLNVWVVPDSSQLVNNGSIAETLLGKISTFTDGSNTWTISPTTNGVDQIRAQWSTVSSVGPWTDIAAYDQDFTITNSVAAGDSVHLFLRIQTPTDTPSNLQHISSLTITAQ